MINVRIANAFSDLVKEDEILSTGLSVLEICENNPTHELTIVIDNDPAIQALNRDYLGIDAPTDVLSFSANEFDPDTSNIYLGDVIISFERAKEQSEKAGHSVMAEIHLLTIHGILHLLGYDHADKEEKAEMWSMQSEILSRLNIVIKRFPEG